jgi:hypothetical protein
MPSKKWGKYLIAAFIILSMVLITASLIMQTETYQEHISSVQYDATYSQTDYQEIRMELAVDEIPAFAISAIPHLLLLAILVGAFMNVRKLESENQPRKDDRLRDLKLLEREEN